MPLLKFSSIHMWKRIYLSILVVIFAWASYFYIKDSNFLFVKQFSGYFDIAATIFFAFTLTYIASRILDYVFGSLKWKFPKNESIWKKLLPLFHNISSIALWILAFLLTASFLGLNLNTLLTWAWISWVLLAIAWKEAATNLFWSISLAFSKMFRIWDRIKVKWYEWVVDEINLTYIKLIDSKGNVIYLPNKNIISESVENLTQWKHKKNEITLNIPSTAQKEDIVRLRSHFEKLSSKIVKNEQFESFELRFDTNPTTWERLFVLCFVWKPKNKDFQKIKSDILEEFFMSLNLF